MKELVFSHVGDVYDHGGKGSNHYTVTPGGNCIAVPESSRLGSAATQCGKRWE